MDAHPRREVPAPDLSRHASELFEWPRQTPGDHARQTPKHGTRDEQGQKQALSQRPPRSLRADRHGADGLPLSNDRRLEDRTVAWAAKRLEHGPARVLQRHRDLELVGNRQGELVAGGYVVPNLSEARAGEALHARDLAVPARAARAAGGDHHQGDGCGGEEDGHAEPDEEPPLEPRADEAGETVHGLSFAST